MRAMTERWDRLAVFCCLGAAALALGLAALHQIGGFGPESDFYGAYAVSARKLLTGQPYTYAYHPPGFAVLLIGMSWLTGDLFVAGKLLNVLGLALFGWLAYRVCRTLSEPRTAFAATLLCLLLSLA